MRIEAASNHERVAARLTREPNDHYNDHMLTLSATEAKRRLLELLRSAEERGEQVVITRRGEPTAVLLPHDEYERLIETLEVLSDRELVKKIRRGLAEANTGATVSVEEALGPSV